MDSRNQVPKQAASPAEASATTCVSGRCLKDQGQVARSTGGPRVQTITEMSRQVLLTGRLTGLRGGCWGTRTRELTRLGSLRKGLSKVGGRTSSQCKAESH